MAAIQGMPFDHLVLVATVAFVSVSCKTVTIGDSFQPGTTPKALHRQQTETHPHYFWERGLFLSSGALAPGASFRFGTHLGDYTYHLDEETFLGYFTCSDADIEVEYSLFGKDEWKTLAINEIPEKKFMPFFGNFYEAALDDIECESDNQWFDLKITMKDKAGNYQTQVMRQILKR